MNSNSKSGKWWYRFLQVLYITVIVIVVLFLVGGLSEMYPTVDKDKTTYGYVCNGDTKQRGNIPGIYVSYEGDMFSPDVDLITRALCSQSNVDTVLESIDSDKTKKEAFRSAISSNDPKLNISLKQNYKIVLVHKVYSTPWLYFVGGSFVAFVLFAVLIILIRAIGLYVIFQESFKKNTVILFKKLWILLKDNR